MKQKYWFSRSLSQKKNKPKTSVPNIKNTIQQNISQKKSQNTINQLQINTQKLKTILQELQEYRKLNQLNHSKLTKEGSIKDVRCLKHNSAVILFCKTENKLLCSNCAFGTTQHNKHKMHEARLMLSSVDQYLMNCQKVLKIKKIDINQQKIEWQKTIGSIQSIRHSTLERLDKEHNQRQKVLSNIYLKYRQQIEQTFNQAQQHLTNLSNTLQGVINSFRFSHSVSWVQQLYYQEVMDRLIKLTKYIPSSKLGERYVLSMKQATKVLISSIKQAYWNMIE